MARLITYGFESGDTAPTSTNGTFATPDTTDPFAGTKYGQVDSADSTASTHRANWTAISGVNNRDYWARFYFKKTGNPSSQRQIARLGDEGAGKIADVFLKTDGTLLLQRNTVNVGSPSAVLANNVWHCIEIRVRCGTTTSNGQVDARLNGVSFASALNSNMGTTNVVNTLRVGVLDATGGSGGVTLQFDQVALNDDQGSSQNSWPGEALGVRAVFGASTTGATSVSVTLPALVLTGDIAVLEATTSGNSLINTPSGWTLADWRYDQGSSGQIVIGVYTKTLASTDAGTTVTLTRTSGVSDVMSASGVTVAGGLGVGVALRMGQDPIATNPNGQTVRLPAIRPAATDLVLAVGGARGYLSTALTAPKVSTAPTGFVVRDNRSVQANALAVAYASWIMSAAGSAVTGTMNVTLGDQSYRLGGMLAITPATAAAVTQPVDASLTGGTIHGYGTSYLGYASDGYSHASEATWYDRVSRAYRQPNDSAYDNNLGTPGAMASDVCGFAYGSVSYYTRAVQTDTNYTVQQAGTWMSQAHRDGMVLLDLVGNDALNHRNTINSATTAKALAGARNAADALIRLLRASSIVLYNDASIAYSAGWSDFSNTDYAGGTCKGTTTPGATATITTTQTDVDLVLFALDDANLGQAGASYTVSVNGTQVASGTTSNQMRKTTDSHYKQSVYCQMCVPVRGMGAGTKTIVITHTGASGTGLYVNGYLIPAASPPRIVINKLAHYNTALFTGLGFGGSNSDMDLYSQIVADVAAQFTDGKVQVFDPLSSGGWDANSMVSTYDNVHLNDVGAAFYAEGVLKTLVTVAYSGTVAVTGGGLVAVVAAKQASGTVAAHGGGSVTLAVLRGAMGAAAVTGGGAVAAVMASRNSLGSVVLTGGGAVTLTGGRQASAPVAVTGGGLVTVAGARQAAGSVAVTGGGLVTVTGVHGAQRAATLTGGGLAAATGAKQASGTVSVSGGGSITIPQAEFGTTVVTGGGLVTVTGVKATGGVAVAVSAAGTVAVAGRRGNSATLTITAGGALAATGTKQAADAAQVHGGGSLAAAATKAATATVALPGGGSITTTGVKALASSVTVTGTGLITSSGEKNTSGAAAPITAATNIACTGTHDAYGTIIVSAATGTTAATGTKNAEGSCTAHGGPGHIMVRVSLRGRIGRGDKHAARHGFTGDPLRTGIAYTHTTTAASPVITRRNEGQVIAR